MTSTVPEHRPGSSERDELWRRLRKFVTRDEPRSAMLSEEEAASIRDQVPFRFVINATSLPEELKKSYRFGQMEEGQRQSELAKVAAR